MSTKLALLSDLHANELALDAVLASIDREGVDAIACLGDVVTLGPRPHEVLGRVKERCRFFVTGNHDEYMEDPSRLLQHATFRPVVDAVQQCREELTAEERAFVRAFAPRVDVLVEGARLVLFHGTPTDNAHDLHACTTDDELDAALAGEAAVWAGGHTHVQFARSFRGGWLVNPGSVGLAFARRPGAQGPRVVAHADYAVVTLDGGRASVQLCRVPLDAKRLLQEARAWDSPYAASLVGHYERCA